ncbi:uncharacterized protein LOC126893697 [Daktulosphaira vitifoliae]|uniref:uncharacterized protein LOC126893697 n=1 Tax=Daktulosphaira vitifoliae TaxID=58002 RepID=UPI0021AA88D7|nr:uncharacterized protein LOC126893697 [Daktulosphaira vitifoliae]
MMLHPSSVYGDCRRNDYSDCYQQNESNHHFYESIKNGLEGFRLQADHDNLRLPGTEVDILNDDNDTASSIASKKRIDSMFDKATATKSIVDNEFVYGFGGDDAASKNTVQEKIEKMFAEVSSSELDTDVSMESTTAEGANKYHVQYIGCAGLSAKISSLEGLQEPVRNMYFAYRKNQEYNSPNNFSGVLEISSVGLTIKYKDIGGDGVHRTSPFPSIAVWAALKFVCRRHQINNATKSYEFAFLPLIADPDGSDKAPLFCDANENEIIQLNAHGDHAPIFAVVMRKTGKQLECHGFVCESENDALLMAANLYGALVKAMSIATESAAPAPRRIKQRNGFTSMSSTAGSSVNGACTTSNQVLPAPPPRPPRRTKKSTTSSSDGMSSSLAEVCSETKTFRMSIRQPPSLRRGVCNSSINTALPQTSPIIRRATPDQINNGSGGDILTKVAIPRSKSFLKTNAPGSKYSRRTAGCGGIETDRRRRSNGSIMGFSDMFNELRIQEGLNNMDDILNVIINVEGMSFNDLKPIYREFLMKLALTLTKDELYQRTKSIMLEQKRKRSKTGQEINECLRKVLNCAKAKSKIGTVLLPHFCKRKRFIKGHQKRKCSCSNVKAATSKNTLPKPAGIVSTGINRKQSEHRKNKRILKRTSAAKCQRLSSTNSTSDDSDFIAIQVQRPKTRKGGQLSSDGCLHQASSGYFSCSECSQATTICGCPSLTKCYCSGLPPSLVSCSCDSDSCADSDKCYCGRRPNIFEELKSRGFAASESSLSVRADSPGTAWKKNEQLLVQQGPAKCGIEASKSLEYLQMKTNDPLHQYSKVNKGAGRMKVYDIQPALDSRSSSSSAAAYSSDQSGSSCHGRRTAESSGSDNFHALDYALFACSRKPQPLLGGKSAWIRSSYTKNNRVPNAYPIRAPIITVPVPKRFSEYYPGAISPQFCHAKPMNKSYSSDMMHNSCQMYLNKRRHSIHDSDLSTIFRTDLTSSLGYYP